MTYRAPLADIGAALKYAADLPAAIDEGLFGDLTMDDVDAVLAEAGRFAGEVIAPLNRVGDTFGMPFKDGAVTTPPGWKEAYKGWAAAAGTASPRRPNGAARRCRRRVSMACQEMWNSASMAFAVGPLLTIAAIDALYAHGSEALKQQLSEKAGVRRMDRHHATHRAAGRLRCRRAAHQGRARGRRQLPHHRAEDLHHLWRARSDRQHHPFRARAPARRAARHARHFAVPGAEISAQRRRFARRRATTCAPIRSSTSSASTPRRPAP